MIAPAKGGAKGATILHLHGGGYTMGSASGSTRLGAQLAEAIGGEALTIDYRLAPEHPYPAALDDCQRAYKWLVKQTKGEIIVSGEDAGGGLAVALMLRLREAGIRLPAALYLISPFADLTISGASLRTYGPSEPLMTREFVKNLAGSYVGSSDMKSPFVSPIFADLRGVSADPYSGGGERSAGR